MPLADDLYKALLDESKMYREKVSAIWLQKFTVLGAIVVFAAARSEVIASNPGLIAAALLSLPLIALLLDIKLGEFGIHANIIDHFIIRHFPEPPVLGEWERTKWGLISNSDERFSLVRLRSILTVAVTVIPTCVISALSVLAARPFLFASEHGGLYGYLRVTVIIFCVLYLAAGLISVPLIVFRR